MADDSSEIVKEQSEAAAAKNVGVMMDGPIFFQNQMYQLAVEIARNAAAMQQENARSSSTIRDAIVGKVAETIIETRPSEGGVDVAALTALAKIVGVQPPVTVSSPNE